MTCPLVALAVLTRQPAAIPSEGFLVARGAQLKRVDANPATVSSEWWHYRLYGPNMPAYGDGFWGVIEAPSYPRLQECLLRIRGQQTTWWEWLKEEGRPEPAPYTVFNAMGPIAVMGSEAWGQSWKLLGPGAPREVAARKRRLEAATALEDVMFGTFDETRWRDTFERDLFRNEGLAIYQAPWLANAMGRLRAFEMALRSTTPLSLNAANADLNAMGEVGVHLIQFADKLTKTKPVTGLLVPPLSNADALSLLNGKFTGYTVNAGEGGAGSEAGTMSFSFTETGFELTSAPAGWYGGMEPVAFASLDPTSVRYDPRFGGEQRGGLVFSPKEGLRATYRGPLGILLPLGTTPAEAEVLAQALRRLVRAGNGIAVPEPEKSAGDQGPDEATRALADRLKEIGERLSAFGSLKFRSAEIAATAPPALALAIDRRNGLWRDSEYYKLFSKQQRSGATFSIGSKTVTPYALMQRLGVPNALTPVEPPAWNIVRVNRAGNVLNLTVRGICRAERKATGKLYTVSRLVLETWSTGSSQPQFSSMRLLQAAEVETPRPVSAAGLAANFFALGEKRLAENKLPEAELAYRRAVTMDPSWASAWNSLGVAVVRQGKVEEAAPYCAQAVQLNPKFVLALTNLADIRRVQGKTGDALDLAAKATSLAPDDPWARTVQGHALFTNGNFPEAEAAYRTVIKLEPKNGAAYADLAGALLRQDKKDEAMVAANQAIHLGWRSHWVYKELGISKE